MSYAGFDTDVFPGLEQMGWVIANTNLRWCGYYLAPAPSHQDDSWMGQRQALVDLGWGLAPVYVGQQVSGPGSKVLSAAQGTEDGADAATLMFDEGFPPNSCVYLDLENGAPFTPPQIEYVKAWVAAVADAGLQPGVYCSHGIAAAVSALCPSARIWAFKVPTVAHTSTAGLTYPALDPAGSGFHNAVAWQRIQNTTLHQAPVTVMNVDLDTASVPDPSAP